MGKLKKIFQIELRLWLQKRFVGIVVGAIACLLLGTLVVPQLADLYIKISANNTIERLQTGVLAEQSNALKHVKEVL